MTTPLLDAFELVAHAEQLLPRLDAAASELAKRPGFEEEKTWLASARQRLAPVRAGSGDLLTRALRLPELEPVRGSHVRLLQGAVVDALEHLHAGIIFAGGPQAPLLEALYYKLKLSSLRREGRDELAKLCLDFEKRLSSTYARRMLADPAYTTVAPALERLHRTVATWRSVFVAPPAADDEAQGLREELETTARRLELPYRQARLLAQAALAPLKELDAAALLQRPKRRGGRTAAQEAEDDTHPILEQEPPDPAEPTPEELAELAAARAAAP